MGANVWIEIRNDSHVEVSIEIFCRAVLEKDGRVVLAPGSRRKVKLPKEDASVELAMIHGDGGASAAAAAGYGGASAAAGYGYGGASAAAPRFLLRLDLIHFDSRRNCYVFHTSSILTNVPRSSLPPPPPLHDHRTNCIRGPDRFFFDPVSRNGPIASGTESIAQSKRRSVDSRSRSQPPDFASIRRPSVARSIWQVIFGFRSFLVSSKKKVVNLASDFRVPIVPSVLKKKL